MRILKNGFKKLQQSNLESSIGTTRSGLINTAWNDRSMLKILALEIKQNISSIGTKDLILSKPWRLSLLRRFIKYSNTNQKSRKYYVFFFFVSFQINIVNVA